VSSAEQASLPAWEQLGELDEYEAVCRARLRHVVPVREPLVLVSQIQRSGGTLLSQLLDGHPECHAHPHELKIGYPRKYDWPSLDLRRPESWFETLFHERTAKLFLGGYDKRAKSGGDFDVFPFVFVPRLQKEIFDACVASRPVESVRDVLDCFFTSYFSAWLDNHNLYTGPKKVVAGFAPRMAMDDGNVEQFFSAYPDGTLISIVRDPHAWFESASAYQPKNYGDVEGALGLWRRSTEAALGASERFDRVVLLTYEQLVLEPEQTMRRVAGRIGITMTPQLLTPTFNGMPIRANSARAVDRHGILRDRAARQGTASGQVDRLAGDLYERAAALAGR
jgi:hypothetical protein